MIGILINKLVNESKTYWDHLPIIIFSYRTMYKVKYTPHQLVYGLHSFMPIKYVSQVINGDRRDANLVKMLTNKVYNIE